MNTLFEKIDQLTREQAIEAATSLCNAVLGGDVEPDPDKGMAENPLTHLNDVEILARILLINAAASAEYTKLAEDAVDGAGRRNIILGGHEIVALVALAVYALKIIKPPLSKEKYEYYDDKGKKVTIERNYSSDGSFLGSIFSKLFKKE